MTHPGKHWVKNSVDRFLHHSWQLFCHFLTMNKRTMEFVWPHSSLASITSVDSTTSSDRCCEACPTSEFLKIRHSGISFQSRVLVQCEVLRRALIYSLSAVGPDIYRDWSTFLGNFRSVLTLWQFIRLKISNVFLNQLLLQPTVMVRFVIIFVPWAALPFLTALRHVSPLLIMLGRSFLTIAWRNTWPQYLVGWLLKCLIIVVVSIPWNQSRINKKSLLKTQTNS